MIVEVINTGTELLLGDILNTNFRIILCYQSMLKGRYAVELLYI